MLLDIRGYYIVLFAFLSARSIFSWGTTPYNGHLFIVFLQSEKKEKKDNMPFK